MKVSRLFILLLLLSLLSCIIIIIVKMCDYMEEVFVSNVQNILKNAELFFDEKIF